MNRVSVQIDSRRRSVTLGGRTTVLQEKSWQVLTMLLQRAPAVISRKDIVREVWQGSFRTGEKGLNQAVWAIRAALGEEPKAEVYPHPAACWVSMDRLECLNWR